MKLSAAARTMCCLNSGNSRNLSDYDNRQNNGNDAANIQELTLLRLARLHMSQKQRGRQ